MVKHLFRISAREDVLMDAEQISLGGYAPLKGFMCKADFDSVLKRMRLSRGEIWSLPVVLDVDKSSIHSLAIGDDVLLVDSRGVDRAVVIVEDIYRHDKLAHSMMVYGTQDLSHPGVARVADMGDMLVGGRVIKILKFAGSSLREFIMSPDQIRNYFKEMRWRTVCAFHSRNVVHRAHEYLQRCAMEFSDGILIHPVVGVTKKDDFRKDVIMHAYKKLITSYYPKIKVLLAALPIGMKFAGPREAVFHALIRRNYGCTHIIIGRDHAGVGGYYEKYAAHKIFSGLSDLGIIPMLFKGPFYCKRCDSVATENTCAHNESERLEISGTLARKLIKEGKRPPSWLMRPEISELLVSFGKDVFC